MKDLQNCWEYIKCKEKGWGDPRNCPVFNAIHLNGVNNGTNAGRCCWMIQETLRSRCLSEKEKLDQCLQCPFYHYVAEQEGSAFQSIPKLKARLDKPKPEMELQKLEVFIVEDDHLACQSLSVLVRETGANVCGTAQSGALFLERAKNINASVVILDWHLPDSNSAELLKKIIATTDMPILVVTGSENPIICLEAILNGASGFLTKLDVLSNLEQALSRVTSGEFYITQDIAEQLNLNKLYADTFKCSSNLTIDEKTILISLLQGKSIHDIALQLSLDLAQVKEKKKTILEKFDASSTADLLRINLKACNS